MSNTTFPQTVYLCDQCAELYKETFNVTESRRTLTEKQECDQCRKSCLGARYIINPQGKRRAPRKTPRPKKRADPAL